MVLTVQKCPDWKLMKMFTNHFVNLMFSNQTTQGNTAPYKVYHHSDSDYNTGVPFALSNGGVNDCILYMVMNWPCLNKRLLITFLTILHMFSCCKKIVIKWPLLCPSFLTMNLILWPISNGEKMVRKYPVTERLHLSVTRGFLLPFSNHFLTLEKGDKITIPVSNLF